MENRINPRKTASRRAVAPPVPRWHGALEGIQGDLLTGWALDAEHVDARVVLEICRNDEVLACVVADAARADLAGQFQAACPGAPAPDACHGFVADLGPGASQLPGRLTVRIANTGLQLPGHADPDKRLAPAVSASSKVFGDGGLRLQGWALDPALEQRQLEVMAYVGNQLVARAHANRTLPSLRSDAVDHHGFMLDLPPALADGRLHSVRVVDQDGNPLNGSPLTVCCHLAGIKPLLPDLPESGGALLADLIDTYEKHVPRSLALAHYPAWSAHYEAGADRPPLAPSLAALRIGILIGGDPSAAELRRTTASLKAQGVPLQVYGKGAYADRLRQALADCCDVLACVRAGDTLAPHALAHALQGFLLPRAQLVYTDSEYAGQPWFKPAWNPEYALASDHPLDGMLFRAGVLQGLLPRQLPQDQASLAWQVLAALWPQGGRAIVHVPRVLYHLHAPLDAAEHGARDAAAGLALRALEPKARLAALDSSAHPQAGAMQAARRLQRPLSASERARAVSLIIPTRDQAALLERCISSIRQYTDWPALQLIVIDNGSSEANTLSYLRRLSKQGVKVLSLPGPFNFADLNNQAVAAASGEIVGLINNDIEALHEGWLDEMVGQLLRPGVGAVGAKLLWPNGMVQHGGVLLGVGNLAGHYGNRLADADWGDHGRNQLVQQVSGVTAACLLLRKKDYLAVGGMDARAFPVAFNDVDLCLKLRDAGKAIVWTPHARLLHAESASRGHEDTPQKRARAQREIDLLRQRWGAVLLRDPAYHPSLNLDPHSHAFGGLALPPRPRAPRLGLLDGSEN